MKPLLICTLFYLAFSSETRFRPYYQIGSIHSERPIFSSTRYAPREMYDPPSQNGVVIVHFDNADNELIARSPPPNFFYKWNLKTQALLKQKQQLEANNEAV